MWIYNKNKVKARSFYRTDDIVVVVIVMIALFVDCFTETQSEYSPAVGANVAQVKHVCNCQVRETKTATCWRTAASSVLLWCLKSSPLETWMLKAEASSSRKGEECIRPPTSADWRGWSPRKEGPPVSSGGGGGGRATGDVTSASKGPQTRY